MNDNSSRFGKYIQLKFQDGKGEWMKFLEAIFERSEIKQNDLVLNLAPENRF